MSFLRSQTLLALKRAESIGLLESLEMATAGMDPLLRPQIRRRVRAAIAGAEAQHPRAEPEQILRLAFLSVHPDTGSVAVEDPLAVTARFNELADSPAVSQRPSRRPTLFGLGVLLLVAGCVGAVLAWGHYKPRAEDAFLTTPFGAALDKPFVRFVVAVDRGADAKLETDELLSSDVKTQVGAAAFDQLAEVLAATVKLRQTSPSPEAFSSYDQRLNRLNLSLEEARVPAFLFGYREEEGGKSSIWLMSYVVRRRFNIRLADTQQRVLWGRRIDGLNFNMTASALWADGYDQMLIPIEHNETYLLNDVLTLAGLGASLAVPYGNEDRRSVIDAGAKAGPLVLQEIVAASLMDAQRIKDLAALVRQRNTAIANLRSKRIVLQRTGTLRLEASSLEQLDELNDPDASSVVRTSSRLEEFQAGVDSVMELLLFVQQRSFVVRLLEQKRLKQTKVELPEIVGPDTIDKRAEISANLIDLIHEEKVPRLVLWRIAEGPFYRYTNARRANGSAFVLVSLARELGIAKDQAFVTSHRWHRDELAAVTAGLFQRPAPEIRDAALKVYRRVFGAEPPTLKVEEINPRQ